MSVRAYRVIEIKTQEASTFNLWHDRELMDYLTKEVGFGELNSDGCGLWEIAVEVLKKTVAEVKMDNFTKETIEVDIADAEAKQEDYITYYCY